MRRALLTTLALVACADSPSPPTRATYVGPTRATLSAPGVRVHLRLDRFGMRVTDASDRVVLDTLDVTPAGQDGARAFGALGATRHAASIRAPIIEGWDHVTGVDGRWLHASSVARAELTATRASLDLFDPASPASTLRVTVEVADAEVRVEASVTGADLDAGADTLNRVGQSFALPADERFFGLGERYVTVDHRGRRYECWVEEGGLGGGERAQAGPTNPYPNGPGMTHVPVPFVLSTRGYGLWIDTTSRSGFDLGAGSADAWRVYIAEPTLRYRVMVHDDPRATLAHFTRLTGRARAPAPWVFAPRRRVDHGSMVRGVPEEEALRTRHVPTTAIDDATHFLPHAAQAGREDELRRWNDRLHALGFKSIGYFNPYVTVNRPGGAALLAYGRANDLFVRQESGAEFVTTLVSAGAQPVVTIDLTKPAAVTWWQGLLQGALDLGYDGWMLDFGEYIPPTARLSDGTSGWRAHNAFPVLVARVSYEYMRRVRGDDFMYFVRAGYTGTQSFTPLVWSGDPSASFDDTRGLPSSVRAGVNAGLSGIPFWGSDVSGYTCLNDPPADKEVYLRWAEFGAVSPDMHDENACAGAATGAPPKWNLWSDDETTDVYARYARLHTRLVPYIHAAAREAEATGVPIMRHPVLVHPHEAEAQRVEFDYWFGPALYTAPVVRRGERLRSLWLPPGGWIDWWTLAPIAGGRRIEREAPLDLLPLYLRAGGVVPMLDPRVETLVADQRDDVVSAPEVAGLYDVRAAVEATTRRGSATLGDGTTFEVNLGDGAVALPAGYTTAAREDDLAACARCGRLDPIAGGAVRVRLSTPSSPGETVQAGGLALRHAGAAPTRVRWDVVVLGAGS